MPGLRHPPATIGIPPPSNATADRLVRPQARPAAVRASESRLAMDRQPEPAPKRTVPVLVRASNTAGPMASASGTSARPGLTTAPCDPDLPSSAVAASGEKVSSWLGRNPAIRPRPLPATIKPPLLATPGGGASFQVRAPGGRMNNSQKLSCRALDPPSWSTAQSALAAPEVAIGSDAAGAPDKPASICAGGLPHAPTTLFPTAPPPSPPPHATPPPPLTST